MGYQVILITRTNPHRFHEEPMREALIFDAVRTPRGKGKKDGSLHEVRRSICLPTCCGRCATAMIWTPARLMTWCWAA